MVQSTALQDIIGPMASATGIPFAMDFQISFHISTNEWGGQGQMAS